MTKEDIKGYTYEQLATLCLQLQGFLDTEREASYKIQAENKMLRDKYKLICKILES